MPPPLFRLLCLLLLLAIVPGSGVARQGAREVMADAMAKMMEAMGLFDSAPRSGTWAVFSRTTGRRGAGPRCALEQSCSGPVARRDDARADAAI